MSFLRKIDKSGLTAASLLCKSDIAMNVPVVGTVPKQYFL